MSDFDWKIYLTKAGKKFLFGAVLGGLTELSAFIGAEPVPSEYVWITIGIVEGIELLINGIKHKFLA